MFVTKNDMKISVKHIADNLILRVMSTSEARENGLRSVLLIEDVEDIVMAFAVPVGDKLIYLTKEDVEQVFTSASEALKTATENLNRDARITPLNEVLGIPGEGDILVVTNSTGMFGAAVIFSPDVVKRIESYSGFQYGFYILPSSVHEVLCVPKEGYSVDALRDMVTDINATQVLPKDVLSNNVYEITDGKFAGVAN